jgi:hypothetical protein
MSCERAPPSDHDANTNVPCWLVTVAGADTPTVPPWGSARVSGAGPVAPASVSATPAVSAASVTFTVR